jgi:hypothetical protein
MSEAKKDCRPQASRTHEKLGDVKNPWQFVIYAWERPRLRYSVIGAIVFFVLLFSLNIHIHTPAVNIDINTTHFLNKVSHAIPGDRAESKHGEPKSEKR